MSLEEDKAFGAVLGAYSLAHQEQETKRVKKKNWWQFWK